MVVSSRRATTLLVCALSAFAAASCDDGPPPAPVAHDSHLAPEPGVLRLAGTGAMTSIAVEIARAWAASHRDRAVIVEPSVGSTGGVRAAADGAVDLGMIARPLSQREQNLGLVLLPIARDAVVIAAHPSVRIDALSAAELTEILWGRRASFADGSPLTMLLRDPDDTAHAALEAWIPALHEAREHAYRTRRFRVLSHDDAMAEALMVTPGAIGPFSLGAISSGKLPLKALGLDGVSPSVAAMQDGRWKATRGLSLVVRADRMARVRDLLSFIASAQGAALLREHGYLPASEQR